jgi:hypothetical protein
MYNSDFVPSKADSAEYLHGDLPYDKALENWQYYLGDTFRFWVGPRPPKDHNRYVEAMRRLEDVFQSHNVIREAIDHYVAALVGQPFNFYLSAADKLVEDLSDKEKKQFDREEKILQDWWDYQGKLGIQSGRGKVLAAAITQMLVTGRGFLRLYEPKRLINQQEKHKKYILHCPELGTISTKRDDDDFLYYASYQAKSGLEIYELLDNGKTKITDPQGTREVDMGGFLPIFEFRGKALITRSIKQCQDSINKSLTLKDINVDAAGLVSRVMLNAQMPGEWIMDPNQPNGEKFVPSDKPLAFGPNQVVYVSGMPIGDPKSPTGYTSPQLLTEQPIDVGVFANGLGISYEVFWLSIGLAHNLSAGDGSLSGRSRETIKGDFTVRLEGISEIIESGISSVFEAVKGFLFPESNCKIVCELNLSTGKPLAEERSQAIAEYQSGLRSRTSAMMLVGVGDPDAEVELIQRERESEVDNLSKLSMREDVPQ